MKTPGQRIQIIKLQTIVRTKIDTTAAMQADINLSMVILANRINRTGGDTFPTPDAMLFSDHNTTSRTLAEGTGWAGGNTGSRVTAQTDEGYKAGRQTAGRVDAYASAGPGNLSVNQPCTGQ